MEWKKHSPVRGRARERERENRRKWNDAVARMVNNRVIVFLRFFEREKEKERDKNVAIVQTKLGACSRETRSGRDLFS